MANLKAGAAAWPLGEECLHMIGTSLLIHTYFSLAVDRFMCKPFHSYNDEDSLGANLERSCPLQELLWPRKQTTNYDNLMARGTQLIAGLSLGSQRSEQSQSICSNPPVDLLHPLN